MGHEGGAGRWKQRFDSYGRAFALLAGDLSAKDLDGYSDLEQVGIAQRFMLTFELAWKALKDYLEYSGVAVPEATPRQVIKECAAVGIFGQAGADPQTFLDMMLTRNALSHVYDSGRFMGALQKINGSYLAELEKLHRFFLGECLQ